MLKSAKRAWRQGYMTPFLGASNPYPITSFLCFWAWELGADRRLGHEWEKHKFNYRRAFLCL